MGGLGTPGGNGSLVVKCGNSEETAEAIATLTTLLREQLQKEKAAHAQALEEQLDLVPIVEALAGERDLLQRDVDELQQHVKNFSAKAPSLAPRPRSKVAYDSVGTASSSSSARKGSDAAAAATAPVASPPRSSKHVPHPLWG